MEITEGHPESVDPVWVQDLIRRAFDNEVTRQRFTFGVGVDDAWELAMWHVFEIRYNLATLRRCAGED